MRFKNKEELKRLLEEKRKVDIRGVSPEGLKELRTVQVRKNQTPDKRMLSYLRQTDNPYIHRIGDVVVKVSFSDSGKSMQDCIEEYLSSEISSNS